MLAARLVVLILIAASLRPAPGAAECPDSFRIVQLTDLHIDAAPCAGANCALTHFDAAVDEINAMVPPPAFVVVTGDVADRGSAEAYSAFNAAARRLSPPLYVIAGNHDDDDALEKARPGVQPFQRYRTFEYCSVLSVLLDSAAGSLGQKQLEWLKGTLRSNRGKSTFVFLHHHILPMPGGGPPMLGDRKEFLEVLAAFPQVRAVISGHTHRVNLQTFNHMYVATSRALFTPAGEAGYRIIEVSKVGEAAFFDKPLGAPARREHGEQPARAATKFVSPADFVMLY